MIISVFSLIYGISNAVSGIQNPIDYIYFSIFIATGFDYVITI